MAPAETMRRARRAVLLLAACAIGWLLESCGGSGGADGGPAAAADGLAASDGASEGARPDGRADGSRPHRDAGDARADGAGPAPLQQIEGAAGDPVGAHLPEIPFPPVDPQSVTWYGTDTLTPVAVSRRELLVVLADGVTVGDANDLLAGLSADIVGANPTGGLLLLRLAEADTPGPVLAAWAALLADPRVAGAMVEDLTQRPLALPQNATDRTPSRRPCPRLPQRRGTPNWVWDLWDPAAGDPVGDNWGLKRGRLPQAWSLRDLALREGRGGPLPVGVIDAGFFSAANADAPALVHLSPNTGVIVEEYKVCSEGAACAGNADCPDGYCEQATGTCELRPRGPGQPPCPANTFCRAATAGSSYCFRLASAVDHGSAVAGIIGAVWGDGAGVTGVVPLPVRIDAHVAAAYEFEVTDAAGNRPAPVFATGRLLSQLLDLVRLTDIRAINNSYGMCNLFCDGGCLDPTTAVVPWLAANGAALTDSWAVYLGRWGEVYHRAVERTVQTYHTKVILVSAAGNCGAPRGTNRTGHTCAAPLNNFTFQAAHCSPLNAAAANHPGTRYLSVSATDWTGALAGFSERNASLAAPGEQVRSTEDHEGVDGDMDGDPLHWTGNGTSFAAPYVAGVITYLWALRPDLGTVELLQLLDALGTADEPVDVFAAALAIDRIREGRPIQRALADIDDHSADGAARWKLWQTGCETAAAVSSANCEERSVPAYSGDGRVDLPDFRALRDALLQVEGVELNGGPDNPGKDLNRDGCVTDAAGVSRPVPGSGRNCADAPPESAHPRADLNGDGALHRTRTAPFGDGRKSDLDVLADVWGQGAGAVTLGYRREQLAALLDSGDLWLDLSLAYQDGVERVTVAAPGLPAGVAGPDVVAAGDVLTIPAGAGLELVVRGYRGGHEVRCLKATFDLSAGEDLRVRPDTPCEPPHFWIAAYPSPQGFSGLCARAHSAWGDDVTMEGGDQQDADPLAPGGGCLSAESGAHLEGQSASAETSGDRTAGHLSVTLTGAIQTGAAEFAITFEGSANGTMENYGQFESVSDASFVLDASLGTDLPEDLWAGWQVRISCSGSGSGSWQAYDGWGEYLGFATFSFGLGGCLAVGPRTGETSWPITGADGPLTLPLADVLSRPNALNAAGSVSGSGVTSQSVATAAGAASLSGAVTIRIEPVP